MEYLTYRTQEDPIISTGAIDIFLLLSDIIMFTPRYDVKQWAYYARSFLFENKFYDSKGVFNNTKTIKKYKTSFAESVYLYPILRAIEQEEHDPVKEFKIHSKNINVLNKLRYKKIYLELKKYEREAER